MFGMTFVPGLFAGIGQPIYSKTLGASIAHADEKPLPSVMAFWFD